MAVDRFGFDNFSRPAAVRNKTIPYTRPGSVSSPQQTGFPRVRSIPYHGSSGRGGLSVQPDNTCSPYVSAKNLVRCVTHRVEVFVTGCAAVILSR